MRTRFLSLTLLATLALTSAACTGGGGSQAPSGGAGLKIGFVTDVGRLEDKSFNEAAWLGIQDAKAKYNAEIDNIVTKDTKDYATNIKAFVDRGYQIIVTTAGTQDVVFQSSTAFNFQSGANEGDTIQIGFEATNTQTLRVSSINLALSSSSNPSLGAEDAIGQIDLALEHLLSQRANLGAVIVRLNEDANNDNIAAVNLQASESQIRDLNVGQETTEFTKLQILVQVGTSVLAQSNSNAQSVIGLFR